MSILTKAKKDEVTYDDLAEIFAGVPSIDQHPELAELARKKSEFAVLLKEKRRQLSESIAPASFGQTVAKGDPVADGEYLVADGDIETLSGNQAENYKADYLRQIAALEKGLQILDTNRRHLLKTVIKQACDNFPSAITDIFLDVLIKAEKLDAAIARAIRADELLNSKSIETIRRPVCLQVSPYFLDLHYGGRTQSLSFMTEILRKSMGE